MISLSAEHLGRLVRVENVMKSFEMDLSTADSNDYIHTDGNLQFKRERRKVGKYVTFSV